MTRSLLYLHDIEAIMVADELNATCVVTNRSQFSENSRSLGFIFERMRITSGNSKYPLHLNCSIQLHCSKKHTKQNFLINVLDQGADVIFQFFFLFTASFIASLFLHFRMKADRYNLFQWGIVVPFGGKK